MYTKYSCFQKSKKSKKSKKNHKNTKIVRLCTEIYGGGDFPERDTHTHYFPHTELCLGFNLPHSDQKSNEN